mmetsp:Transcript_5594/g.10045  ORF Transcript_5594/g.10045 Transcript_5594/m.10045 type:complete len:776 (+) Transcript_5594:139-2466(+)
MMESTLVTDGSDPNSGGLSTNMNGNSLFGGDDNELFGPPPTTMTGGTTTNGGSKSDLMGQLLGESAEIKPSSIPAAPSNNVTVSAPSVAPVVVTSKLSTSGLLESSSSGLFGDDDDGAGGGGGGSGLFDDVDAEAERKERQQRMEAADALAQQKMQEEQRRQREAELAQQLQLGSQQQQFQQNISMESNVDIMHELNLNDNNGEFMGMGMGLGGEIPKSPPPAAAPPMPAQYQQYPYQPPPPQQQQQQQQQQGVMNAMAGSYYYSTTGAGQMTGQPTQTATARRQHAPPQPSVLAGMHVGHDVNLGGVAPPPAGTAAHSPSKYHSGQANNFPPAPSAITNYVPAAPFDPRYGRIVVNDPMLIQGSGLFAGPPHWTYLVTVHSKNAKSPQKQSQPQPPLSAVRRRFRHFVALEDRLRTSVPGAILPPRPDKHPARAIEEATARQSSDFAQQRSNELSVYMNALVHHPHAGLSPEVKLFLTLQDHIGTAWPEVSSSAFTRMTAVGTATVEKLTDTMDGMLSELGTAQQVAAGEDSAEILALAAYEGRRIGAVSSSVPKVEGAVGLIRDRGDRLGATGLEMSKLAKDVAWCDRDLATPMEVLSSALLRSGRRTKRLGLELGAAVAPFVIQYRSCRYEQMAFADRRSVLKRRTEARTKADGRAAKLMMNQTSMQSMGRLGTLERMETEAAMYDEMATEAGREAEEVALRLQTEVGRIGAIRVREWDSSMKVIASGMKEACAENAAVWESALEAFKREFPDCPETTMMDSSVVSSGIRGV